VYLTNIKVLDKVNVQDLHSHHVRQHYISTRSLN